MMAWFDEIPLEQKMSVEELRKRTMNECTPKMLEDPFLFYRFMKGCSFSLKNAESMLRKHIVWRRENQIDTLLDDFKCPEVIQKYFPISRIGYDKDGCPITYIGIGKADDIGILKSCSASDILKYVTYRLEEDSAILCQQRQKSERLNIQFVYIYDCDRLTFQAVTNKTNIQLCLQIAGTFQDNFPEFVKAVYVINAPAYFTYIFSILKLVITTGLIRKIQVFGTDGWKEKLLENIDDEVLPAFLGGKRTDPDGNPLCRSLICPGGKIPERYFLSSNKSTIRHQDGVKRLVVSRRSSTDVVIDVLHPSSLLMWEFEAMDRDIGFGINYKIPDQNDGEIIELIPKKRIDTSNGPETGTYVCHNAGSHILVFDNSYSWLHSKEIYYKAKVIPPTITDL